MISLTAFLFRKQGLLIRPLKVVLRGLPLVSLIILLVGALAPAGAVQAAPYAGAGEEFINSPGLTVMNKAPTPPAVVQPAIRGADFNPGFDNQSLQAAMDPQVAQALQLYLTETAKGTTDKPVVVVSPTYFQFSQQVSATNQAAASGVAISPQAQAKLNQLTSKFVKVQSVLGDELAYLILVHNVQNQERSYLKAMARANMDTTLVSQAFATFNQSVGRADGDFYTAQTIVQTHAAFSDSGTALVIGDAFDTIRSANNAMLITHDAYQGALATLALNFKYAKRANHHLRFFNIPVIE